MIIIYCCFFVYKKINFTYKIIYGNHNIFVNDTLKYIKCVSDEPLDDRFYSEIYMLKNLPKDYNLASKNSYDILKYLKQNIKQEIILGPSVCNVFKLNNNYRFQIIIKYKDVNNILPFLTRLEQHYFNKKDIKIEIDFNPLKF